MGDKILLLKNYRNIQHKYRYMSVLYDVSHKLKRTKSILIVYILHAFYALLKEIYKAREDEEEDVNS